MTPNQFRELKHPWRSLAPHVDRLSYGLVFTLDAFQSWLFAKFGPGATVVIHCSFEERESGYHPKGMAVDFHIVGLSCVDAYLAAERFDAFNGIGVYPDWNNPGLHADNRPNRGPDSRWGCKLINGRQVYVPLDAAFLSYCLRKE